MQKSNLKCRERQSGNTVWHKRQVCEEIYVYSASYNDGQIFLPVALYLKAMA